MLRFFSKAQPWAYQAMRIVFGVLFAFHGAQKLFGLFGGARVVLLSQFGAAGVIELVGGLLIAAGVAVTPIALLASGEMAFAYFQSHGPRSPVPIQNGGELAVLYSFAFLYIATRGRR